MEEPQSHLTASVTKFQIQGYVIISIEIKVMNLRIKDNSENNQHSSLTNYANCKHPFLVTVYQIIYCIASHTHDIWEYQKPYNRAANINELNTEF